MIFSTPKVVIATLCNINLVLRQEELKEEEKTLPRKNRAVRTNDNGEDETFQELIEYNKDLLIRRISSNDMNNDFNSKLNISEIDEEFKEF